MTTTLIARLLPLLCAAALLGAACEKKEPAPPADTASAAPAAPPPAPSVEATPQLADADLAVPEDFEDDAEKEISASNYKAELGAIEKELEAPE